VLQELVGDKSLERFRQEYDKLHRALKKSHESEKRLIKKCRELNQEIVANAAKVQTALKLSQEDQNTIASLKREIEKAWKMVDAAHEKEGRAKETIQQLKHEIQNLSRLVEQGAGLSIGQENTVNELVKVKGELAKERESQAAQIASLTAEIQAYLSKIGSVEGEISAAQDEMTSLREVISTRKADSEKEAAKKEKLESELKTLRGQLEARQQEIKDKVTALTKAQEGVARNEILLREEKGRTDKASKETEVLSSKHVKVTRECDEAAHTLQQMVTDGAQRQVEIKLRQDERERCHADLERIKKTTDAAGKKLQQKRELKAQDEKDKEDAKVEINELEAKLEAARTEHEREKRELDEQLRERDILNKKVVLAAGATQKQLDQVKVHENTRRNLELEISGYKAEAHKQRKSLFLLEKDGEKYGAEAAEATSKYSQALEEVKVREMSIIQLQKRISEGETKLKQQQALYEAVRSDRNLYSKNLIESQDEIAEMKRKFKIMNHQIDQLKEEIHTKDQNLVREHFDRMKVEKEKELLRDNLQKLRTREQQSEDYLAQMSAETTKLNSIINEADKERQRQRKECEIVVNERDILGTQLIRRNEELGLLYERIRIQKSTLQKGEQQYNTRLREIGALKRRIRDLADEMGGLKGSVTNLETLRNEVYQLQRELLQERTKVRALSEELENPMNVHRWRKLEGSDPATYELVQKTHMLQKRLIEKSEEVVDKDLLIRHKEKLYVELKNILARQPGPEVAEQLSTYQQSLAERAKQIEQMDAELSMSHTQASEYKFEISRINKELIEVKKKFYEQRKREQAQLEQRRAERAQPTELLVQEARSTLNRFTGGGFNLNMPAS
jgi:chromosome segregation ATPase